VQSPERDIQHIRLVGGFLFGVGIIQLILTFVVLLWGLFAGIASDVPSFVKGATAVALSLIMASVMSSCAIQMQRIKGLTSAQIQNIRLVWTALVLLMAASGILALWVAPPLTTLSVLVLLALFTARGPIIRLSS
jgi:hypothetical protein